ncbi:DUF1934 domain-containing protein [Novisyntrophococcus fermenticellae]|uniref:DUF1934 domain-containing protein n=1 Tax=Novisyntrophococcus fermenticellae TaxID=2068655 RepID=UPI001E41CD3B|nr:DUF1934 domain-containing protein [Novisyntrophococcus fermenticellae]
MTKDVIIYISGLQYMEGANHSEAEPIEIVVGGQYFKKDEKHYLIYDEMMDGPENKTRNIMKFDSNKMELNKKGLVNVQMVFEENKKNLSYYRTSYGMLNMGVAATRIKIDEQEDTIGVLVDYALDMNESYVADCTIALTIRAKG